MSFFKSLLESHKTNLLSIQQAIIDAKGDCAITPSTMKVGVKGATADIDLTGIDFTHVNVDNVATAIMLATQGAKILLDRGVTGCRVVFNFDHFGGEHGSMDHGPLQTVSIDTAPYANNYHVPMVSDMGEYQGVYNIRFYIDGDEVDLSGGDIWGTVDRSKILAKLKRIKIGE